MDKKTFYLMAIIFIIAGIYSGEIEVCIPFAILFVLIGWGYGKLEDRRYDKKANKEANIEENIVENIEENNVETETTVTQESIVPDLITEEKYCKECGAKLQENQKYCSECGTKVS